MIIEFGFDTFVTILTSYSVARIQGNYFGLDKWSNKTTLIKRFTYPKMTYI